MSDYAQKIAEIARLNDALAYVLEQVPASNREAVRNKAHAIVEGRNVPAKE